MGKKLTQEEVLRRFREVHGDKYDYNRVVFLTMKGSVEIICDLHGSFKQRVSRHLNGLDCPGCRKAVRAEQAK